MTGTGGQDSQLFESRLLKARDEEITQVVAMIDTLSPRGAADALIAPLRPRLALLRPSRPLGFCRLLFTPFNPVIVPLRGWRPQHKSVPRSVLMPIAATVARELGPNARLIDAETEKPVSSGTTAEANACARLWPAAAAVLQSAPAPEDWDKTELPLAVYAPLARRLGAVLQQEPVLATLDRIAATGDLRTIEVMLKQVGADAVPLISAVALARTPAIAALLVKANDGMAKLVLEILSGPSGPGTQITLAPLGEVGLRLGEQVASLRAMEANITSAEFRRQLHEVRQHLDEVSLARFTSALETEFLIQLRALGLSRNTEDITGIETAARALRALELEARVLGGGDVYDRLLRQGVEAILACGRNRGINKIETIRLVEILAGSAAALALL